MHALCHPPGESLRIPNPSQARGRIVSQQVIVFVFVVNVQSAREHHHIGKCQVHPFCASRRNDVRAVAGKEKPTILHRFDDETAHRRNALLQHLAFGEFAGSAEPPVQFVPDTVVGPGFNLLIVITLKIEPRQAWGTHGVERKAAISVGIDQFVIGWRALRQDAQPAERIVSFEYTEHAVRNARPADAVEAVATHYEIAVDFLASPAMLETDFRFLRLQVVNCDVVDLKEQRRAVGNSTVHEILHHFLLPVNRNALVHQFFEVNTVQIAIDADIDPPMQHALALHAAADADVDEEVSSPMLDQAGTDAILDVIAAAVFDDDRLDALKMQQPCQHKSSGPRSDNSDLRPYHLLPADNFALPYKPRSGSGKGTLTGNHCTMALR